VVAGALRGGRRSSLRLAALVIGAPPGWSTTCGYMLFTRW